ncbi:uncharacterized protein LOC132274946 [Cornus florida]|uniref:uncharacterized protein LOC132274946 n=1 Tax=Cornus florida TaxID=4283 RepID=UPI002897CBE9|nr:uncharacterized protein LOC132274946 [Cornus florida]
MYPKVKVREQEQDDQDRSFLPSLEAFESLSIHDFDSPANESKYGSPASIVRIPTHHISNSATPAVPVVKEAGKNNSSNRKDVEDSKPNIRAGSILRPRAVLSSPDNDGMIRSRKKTRAELMSGLKNHNLCQNRHTQCKVEPRTIVAESPISMRRDSKDAADRKTDPKGRKVSFVADPSKTTHLGKGKPLCVRI